MDDPAKATLERDVATLMRAAIASSVPSRARRIWRDAVLGALAVGLVVCLFLVGVALGRAQPAPPPPGLIVIHDPVTGVRYQCPLVDADPVLEYDCSTRRS